MGPRSRCCARLHWESVWNSKRLHNCVVQDSNHRALEVFNFKAEWGATISFNVPRTSWVLCRNVGRTQKLMVWWSWKHCQDCRSDVSGSDSVEFQEARMWLTQAQNIREYLVVLSKHIGRADCWPDTVDLASYLRWTEDLKNWVPTELRHFGNGQSIVVKMKWFWRDLETLVFVSGYFPFAGGGYFGKIWNPRAQSWLKQCCLGWIVLCRRCT